MRQRDYFISLQIDGEQAVYKISSSTDSGNHDYRQKRIKKCKKLSRRHNRNGENFFLFE